MGIKIQGRYMKIALLAIGLLIGVLLLGIKSIDLIMTYWVLNQIGKEVIRWIDDDEQEL